MLPQKTKTIGAHEYKVRMLPATKGRVVMLTLARVLGPAAGVAATAKGGDNAALLEPLFKSVLQGLTADDLNAVCNIFADSTDVVIHDDKGKREPQLSKIFDLHFAGKYDEMLAWLIFCVEVNFGSFFDGLKTRSVGT